ncbi:MAG TPA: ABC transporter substrate-binding protein [Nitrospira sp.]|nr:ABC transporter substrate-binding protein [Nitrospira sp.]
MNSTRHTIHQLAAWSMVVAMMMSFVPVAPAGASLPQSPMQAVRSTIEDVIHILTNESLKQPERLTERRQEIERLIRERVSYEDMAKQALGAHWLTLETSERQEFIDLFVQLLRDSFAGKIDAYAGEHVLYVSEQQNDRFAEVRTKLSGRKTDTLLDFRMIDQAGVWLVYDVVIDGASIVHNYRAQFASIIRDASYVGLLERMREKTFVVKGFETHSAPVPAL